MTWSKQSMFTLTNHPKISLAVKAFVLLCLLAYPVLVYFGLAYIDVRLLGALLLLVILLRMIVLRQQPKKQTLLFLAIGISIAIAVIVSNQLIFLKLYPVCISLLMLGIFGYTLIYPPTIIETIARRSFKDKEMPEKVISYTRNVTKVWCLFFLGNALIASYTTLFSTMEIWTLYNGLISYLIMGTLFAGEFIYRHLKIKRDGEA